MHTKRPADTLPQRNIARYGWRPDLPDRRDLLFSSITPYSKLPMLVDQRPQMPPVYDQGALGSCTANAIGGAVQFGHRKQNLADFVPSRLFIYYNERVMEGTVGFDAGAMIRDGMKSVAKLGAPPEADWPYVISQFTRQPPARAYTDASKTKAVVYSRVAQSLSQIKGCLAQGYPFVFGFTVYESFESDAVASTGIMPMPKPTEEILGGHAVMAVGYDESRRMMIVRNSWGAE